MTMDVEEIEGLFERILSRTSFNLNCLQCQVLIDLCKRARDMFSKHERERRDEGDLEDSFMDLGCGRRAVLRRGLYWVLIRVDALLQTSAEFYNLSSKFLGAIDIPRYFSSLYLELSWYNKIMELSVLYPTDRVFYLLESSDKMCLDRMFLDGTVVHNLFLDLSNRDIMMALERWNKLRGSEEDDLPAPLCSQRMKLVLDGATPDVPYSSGLPSHLWIDYNDLKWEGKLGHGGSGTVFKVRIGDGTFAAKCFHSSVDMNEAAIHSKLSHPNIVRMIGFSRDARGMFVLVMELMDSNLREWIDDVGEQRETWGSDGSSWLEVALDVLLQIAEGMRYLRQHRVIHRDLKSFNVLVDREHAKSPGFFNVKIADFGLSRSKTDENSYFTTPKQGTACWRAPEVLKANENSKYTFTADVWSYGMIAWEVLTGGIPFEDCNPSEYLRMVELEGKRPDWPSGSWIHPGCTERCWDLCWANWPLQSARGIHPYLVGCIKRCWDLCPENRPSFESICMTLTHLKGLITGYSSLYDISAAVVLADDDRELAGMHKRFEKNLDEWWVTVLVEGVVGRSEVPAVLEKSLQSLDFFHEFLQFQIHAGKLEPKQIVFFKDLMKENRMMEIEMEMEMETYLY